jgi:hypothetical protein
MTGIAPGVSALMAEQVSLYRRAGHLTVPGVFTDAQTDAAIADVMAWGESFVQTLTAEQRAWYLEREMPGAEALRKLDNPVKHRDAFRRLASHAPLVAMAEQLLAARAPGTPGSGVSVYFSQIFFKPPGGGGPKPVHQDNFYFGPNDRRA